MVPSVKPDPSGKERIGMLIMPYNFKETVGKDTVLYNSGVFTWKQAWANFYGGSPSSSQTITGVRVNCFREDKPGNEFTKTVDIGSPEKPVSVFDKVEMGSKENSYKCEWSYETGDDGSYDLTDIGKVIDLSENYNSDPIQNLPVVREHFVDKYNAVPERGVTRLTGEGEATYSFDENTENTVVK